MKTVGIAFNTEKPKAVSEMRDLAEWLRARDCTVAVLSPDDTEIPPLDFALALGGDGTMLKAARLLAPRGVPILGINLGSLGFLAETDPHESYRFLQDILDKGFTVEERMMFAVAITSGGRTVRDSALNDCTIRSGTSGRVVTVSVKVDAEFLADYLGDGLIVATPTGSTAYSLAASGPIVHPHLSVYILTPICPHTLAQRPMIISVNHRLVLQANSSDEHQPPILSLDGQTGYPLDPADIVTISPSPTPLKLIINPARKYLQVLRTKLKWGERG